MQIRTKVVTQSGRNLAPPGIIIEVDEETAGRWFADGRGEPVIITHVAPIAGIEIPGGSTSKPGQGDLGEGTDAEQLLEAKKAEYRRAAAEAGFEGDEIEEAVRQRLEYDALVEGGMDPHEAREEMAKRYPGDDEDDESENSADDAEAAQRAIEEEAEFYKELNAADAIEWVSGLDIAALERISKLENAREQGARVTVTRAIEGRLAQLKEVETQS